MRHQRRAVNVQIHNFAMSFVAHTLLPTIIPFTRCSGRSARHGQPLQLDNCCKVTYKVIGGAPTAPTKALSHFCEPFRLNQVIEGERREHCAVSVYIALDKQCSAADTVQVDNVLGVASGIWKTCQ